MASHRLFTMASLTSSGTSITTKSTVTNAIPSEYINRQPTKESPQSSIITLSTIGCSTNKKSSDLKITGTYKEDYNIRSLHNKVVRILEEKTYILLEELQIEEQDIKAKLRIKTKQIELKPLLKRLRQIRAQLETLDCEATLREYYERAKPLLDEYGTIGPLQNKVRIGESANEEYVIRTREHDLRLRIIADYLVLAAKYVDIDITREVQGIEYCTTCGVLLEDDEEDDNGYLICPQCKVQIPTFYNSGEYTESNLKYNTKNSYFNKDTLLEEFMSIQGKEMISLPEDYKERLDEYFAGMTPSPISDIVKEWPLCEDGTRLGTTRKMMLDAFKAVGMNKYYGNVYKICREYWGWQLWDFDNNFRDALLEDYDVQQRVLLTIPTDKTSAINAQYNLHWLFRKRGVKCKPSHFKIPKTLEILQDYERRRRAACKILAEYDPAWACPWTISEHDLEI